MRTGQARGRSCPWRSASVPWARRRMRPWRLAGRAFIERLGRSRPSSVISCSTVLLLPHSSTAVHVRTISRAVPGATVDQGHGIRVADFHFGVAVVRPLRLPRGCPRCSRCRMTASCPAGYTVNSGASVSNQVDGLYQRIAVAALVRRHVSPQVASGAGTAEFLVGEELPTFDRLRHSCRSTVA